MRAPACTGRSVRAIWAPPVPEVQLWSGGLFEGNLLTETDSVGE
jgi:hypothetical protein